MCYLWKNVYKWLYTDDILHLFSNFEYGRDIFWGLVFGVLSKVDHPNQSSEPSFISEDEAIFLRGKRNKDLGQFSVFANVEYWSHKEGFSQYCFYEVMQIETLSEVYLCIVIYASAGLF